MASPTRKKRRIDPSLLTMFGILALVVAVVLVREGMDGVVEERFGGTVTFTSKSGDTIFVVRLPIAGVLT
ncbi:MAG: hypothetical protein O2826_04470 [Chloroflexi bacterium]|nr:hypothetical protein [Chloroflexota bacterium]MDA1173757.1 hypothetical protein [Chloroflexota bacterium]